MGTNFEPHAISQTGIRLATGSLGLTFVLLATASTTIFARPSSEADDRRAFWMEEEVLCFTEQRFGACSLNP